MRTFFYLILSIGFVHPSYATETVKAFNIYTAVHFSELLDTDEPTQDEYIRVEVAKHVNHLKLSPLFIRFLKCAKSTDRCEEVKIDGRKTGWTLLEAYLRASNDLARSFNEAASMGFGTGAFLVTLGICTIVTNVAAPLACGGLGLLFGTVTGGGVYFLSVPPNVTDSQIVFAGSDGHSDITQDRSAADLARRIEIDLYQVMY